MSLEKKVWKKTCEIPYGEVITYKNIVKKLTEEENKKVSSRAGEVQLVIILFR